MSSQLNNNTSHVLDNTSSTVLNGIGGLSSNSSVPASGAAINTALSGSNTSAGVDSSTENGNYATAVTTSTKATAAVQKATLFGNVANAAHFLPTNGVTVTSGEFNATGATGNYQTAASWTATPTLAGNASAFTLTDTADSGKTFTLAESISGSPFTTRNGAVHEALTFRGATANDTLAIQHKVAVANTPALTNNNTGSALDVRNESYAENYVKTGVTSSYALNTTHKYAEITSNQSLNDARAENFAYKDAGLTINSSVKTAVADAAYINGVEKIVENNAANYHYASTVVSSAAGVVPVVVGTAGTIDYVVTDVRNLAQVDQRTYTNITTTNLAQFKVVDKTVAAVSGGDLTVDASGVIVGTTTNLSTAASLLLGATTQATAFAPTNTHFTVSNTAYSLAVDAGQFTTNALNQNVFDHLLGLGNGGALFSPITNNGVTNQPVVPAALASAKYLPAATGVFAGTDFNDVITIKDVAGTVAGTFVGGNVNAGAGNDTITGSKGNDIIAGGAGADSIVGGAGTNVLTGNAGQDTFVVSGTDTITDFVVNVAAVAGVPAVAANPVTGAPAVAAVPAVLAVFGDTVTVKDGSTANIVTGADSHFYTAVTAGTTDVTVKTADDLAKNGVSTVDYSKETAGSVILGTAAADKIIAGAFNDTITGGAGADSIVATGGNDTITDFSLGTDNLTVAKGTSTATVTVIDAAGVSTIYNIAANATADTIIPVTAKTAADLALIPGVKAANPFDHSAFTTADTITGTANADTIIAGSGATIINGVGGKNTNTLGAATDVADVVAYKAPTASAMKTEANDTVNNFTTGADKIQLPVKLAFGGTAYVVGDALKAVDFVDATTAIAADTANKGRFIFDATAKTLSFDSKGDDTSATAGGAVVDTAADDFVVITGISALAATDFIFA